MPVDWERMSDQELWMFKNRIEGEFDHSAVDNMRQMHEESCERQSENAETEITKKEKITEKEKAEA